MSEALINPIKLVIFDLDGTLVQTETLVLSVARDIVLSHGKELTEEAIAAALGRRPLEAWAVTADLLGISATPQELFEQSEPMLSERWHEAGILPGALRLVSHLRAAGVPLALATSTSRGSLTRKLSSKPDLREAFVTVCCGDDPDIKLGKPAPDCYLKVALEQGVPPENCLVFEDAPAGVEAAVAAGMRVVVIPSLRSKSEYPTPTPNAASGVVEVIPSLLAFEPECYGLPKFSDKIGETIPLDAVWRISGTVTRGFGRGSKQLGIPTANLDSASLANSLAEAVTGIYGGFASIGNSEAVYPMVMSVGWNSVFGNKEKTCEPWLLHEFEENFYDEEIRLVVVAFIRPEANFPSVDALVERIHRDAEVTREALIHEMYAGYKTDSFLKF
jgi:HAD superfamily hydrolase (TIGR01509 family)